LDRLSRRQLLRDRRRGEAFTALVADLATPIHVPLEIGQLQIADDEALVEGGDQVL
jgi:hypothetical protein